MNEENLNKCAQIVADFISENAINTDRILSDSYYYNSLPLCVIDAVFSIGVKYTSVLNVINNFAQHYNIPIYRNDRNELPDVGGQLTVTEAIDNLKEHNIDYLSNNIFRNRQRTSTKNGILKAEAVLLFLKKLQRAKVENFQNLETLNQQQLKNLIQDLKSIKGQKSGVSIDYFLMLSGSEELIKPDRMILRFLVENGFENISTANAIDYLSRINERLKHSYGFNMTLRELDHIIWNLQRA